MLQLSGTTLVNHFDYRDGVLHAEGVDLVGLAEAVGTPFYCYSTATIERHYKVFAGAFADVPSEQPWVVLAKKELNEPSERLPTGEKRWKAARESLARARTLRDQGNRAAAEAVWNGLEELYKNDPSATPILEEMQRDRGG